MKIKEKFRAVSADWACTMIRDGVCRIPFLQGLGHRLLWKLNISEEIRFWDDFLGTRGGQWPDVFQMEVSPETPLQQELQELLQTPPGGTLEVLDVGAGPLTRLGKTWPDRKINITAIDPLAARYDRLMKKHKIVPPVRTCIGEAEQLLSQFMRGQFDFVYAHNCIDHSYDPIRAISQMVEVVKTSGHVYLRHKVREAENHSYKGLHQWNFYAEEGDFMVAGKTKVVNITRMLQDRTNVSVEINENNAIIVVIKKTA